MGVDIKVGRSGSAILRTLLDLAPDESESFTTEYRAALSRAARSFDLSESEEILNRWWGIANLRANPPTAQERETARLLESGEDVGWSSPEEWIAAHGS